MPIPKYNTFNFKEEIMTLVSVNEYVFACMTALKLTFLTLLIGKEPN